MAVAQVRFPCVDGGVERLVASGCGHEPVTVAIPGECLGDAASAELLESCALSGVALADVLVEDLDCGAVPVDECFATTAGFDGVEPSARPISAYEPKGSSCPVSRRGHRGPTEST